LCPVLGDHFRIFVEKTAIVTANDLDGNSDYPQPGTIACEIIEIWQDGNGRKLATVNTTNPWGVTDETGESQFQVLLSQIVDE
jgi:hypothetical protein